MWVFSNFQLSNVVLDGQTYATVEHAYQAAKTLDAAERELIRTAPTPGRAKRLGRRATLRPDWEQIKNEVMYDLLTQKFSREPWRTALLNTRGVQLVEWTTWHDLYWGRCICTAHYGQGRNVLGLLLMDVREALQV